MRWVTTNLPGTFFLGVDDDPVTAAYTDVMMWVQRHSQYFNHAKVPYTDAFRMLKDLAVRFEFGEAL